MRCRVKLFSTSPTILAADSSHIPAQVLMDYLESDSYKRAIENKSMVGGLSHRARNVQNCKNSGNTSTLSKTIGKDDMQILVGENAAPIFYITKLELMPDSWCYANIQLFDEALADDEAAQSIKRLKYLLLSGVKPGVSAVVLGYWDSSNKGCDVLRKMVSIKGLDVTLNPSWKDAQVVETYDDDGNLVGEKAFSDVNSPVSPEDYKFTGLKVKAFSDLSLLGCQDIPKTSKINGQFTRLAAKVYSATGGMVESLPDEDKGSSYQEKSFSVASIKDRVREAKLSPRLRFRKLYIYYKQVVQQMGGVDKMDEDVLRILKSLFTSDVLDIMKSITPLVIEGRPINSLIGAASLGKGPRVACQKLQLPYRMAMQEAKKNGFLSKMRYQKLQEAYLDFINSLIEDVFGSSQTPIPEDIDEEN